MQELKQLQRSGGGVKFVLEDVEDDGDAAGKKQQQHGLRRQKTLEVPVEPELVEINPDEN